MMQLEIIVNKYLGRAQGTEVRPRWLFDKAIYAAARASGMPHDDAVVRACTERGVRWYEQRGAMSAQELADEAGVERYIVEYFYRKIRKARESVDAKKI